MNRLLLTVKLYIIELKQHLTYFIFQRLAESESLFSDQSRAHFRKRAANRVPSQSLDLTKFDTDRALGIFTRRIKRGRIKGQVNKNELIPNVLVVSHSGDLSGAPIVSYNLAAHLKQKYNVFILCLKGGELVNDFMKVAVDVRILNPGNSKISLSARQFKNFLKQGKFDFILLNSVNSAKLLRIINKQKIPSVSLIHEFASSMGTDKLFYDAIMRSNEVIFSSILTLDDASRAFDFDIKSHPNISIIPQGKCLVPVGDIKSDDDNKNKSSLKEFLRPSSPKIDFLIIGVGSVEYRKGVDLFIETARKTFKYVNSLSLRFAWIGHGYEPHRDMKYSNYLQDQLSRSGLGKNFAFIPPTKFIEEIYQSADLLLLTSRLDPLPNVAIDMMSIGRPVLCFENASGIAEIFKQTDLNRYCVADYLDSNDLAKKLSVIINSKDVYNSVSNDTRDLSGKQFNFDSYMKNVERLAKRRSPSMTDVIETEFKSNINLLIVEPRFDTYYVAPNQAHKKSRTEIIKLYLKNLSRGLHPRRAEPGFNPFLFANSDYFNKHREYWKDPYSEFIRLGRPSGRWISPLIINDTSAEFNDIKIGLKSALHIHAYYIDDFSSILDRLCLNSVYPDLYISVKDEASKNHVLNILSRYKFLYNIRIVPNRGRAIGPLLTEFGPDLVDRYEVIGHVHTKKSLSMNNRIAAKQWRDFLFENLLGGQQSGRMFDRIIYEFNNNPSLGIIYPSDPNVIGWSDNFEFASDFMAKLKLTDLPEYFDFPVGTMFWIRSKALKPFVDLNLGWDDFPLEPTFYDGSILHALERLFGIVPIKNGFTSSLTYTQGISR